MIRFKDWAPTGFDPKGEGSEGQEDWLVLPMARTRDTGPFEESNFEAALKILGGESDTVQVHRFGHWGPGWIEIIVVHPSREKDAEEIISSIENYPALDEEDLTAREYEDFQENWENWGESEFEDQIKSHFELSEEEEELFDWVDITGLWSEIANNINWEYQHNGSEVIINFKEAIRYLTEHDELLRDALKKAESSPLLLAYQKAQEDEKLDRWYKATRGRNPACGRRRRWPRRRTSS